MYIVQKYLLLDYRLKVSFKNRIEPPVLLKFCSCAEVKNIAISSKCNMFTPELQKYPTDLQIR